MNSMRFGVNYVPSKNWWYSWMDWDDNSIRADLESIARLGMDHIRVHCLWNYFQPNPNEVSALAVERLVRLHEHAAEFDMDVCVTVLDGWLSGFEFYPAWIKSANMFTDPEVIEAQERLFTALGRALGKHPRFLGFDLGNELGVPQLIRHPVTPSEADAWQARMLAICEAVAPGRSHVNGVDHNHWFSDRGFSRRALATEGAMTSLHTWIGFTGALDIYGPMGVGSLHLPEYNVELAKAYHTDPMRPVWIQEFGIAETWIESARTGEFAEAAYTAIAECEGVWGCTWWCSHDIDPRYAGFDEMEYDLGLLAVDNAIKPVGRAVQSFIERERRTPTAPVKRTCTLELDEREISSPTSPEGWTFARKFMDRVAEGEHPRIQLIP